MNKQGVRSHNPYNDTAALIYTTILLLIIVGELIILPNLATSSWFNSQADGPMRADQARGPLMLTDLTFETIFDTVVPSVVKIDFVRP